MGTQVTRAASSSNVPASSGEAIGLTIMGTIIQGSPEDNVALVKEKSGRVQAVKPGYKVIEGAYTVAVVSAKHIEIVDKQGKAQIVFQDKFAGEYRRSPRTAAANARRDNENSFSEEGFERRNNTITMTAMYRDKLVREDLAKVLMQATAEPFIENGQIIGFRFSQIDSDSIYFKSGLQNGDVVTIINGQELTNVAASIALLKSLKDAPSLAISLRRGGEPVELSIVVK